MRYHFAITRTLTKVTVINKQWHTKSRSTPSGQQLVTILNNWRSRSDWRSYFRKSAFSAVVLKVFFSFRIVKKAAAQLAQWRWDNRQNLWLSFDGCNTIKTDPIQRISHLRLSHYSGLFKKSECPQQGWTLRLLRVNRDHGFSNPNSGVGRLSRYMYLDSKE